MIDPRDCKMGIRRNSRTGIALLELLISLAVMAAIALILTSVLRFTGQALERVRPDRLETGLLLARHNLRRKIETMPALGKVSGTGEQLSFQTLIDNPPFDVSELTTVNVFQEQSGALIFEAGIQETGGSARREVLHPVSDGVRIRYFGSKRQRGLPAWHQNWKPAEGLPDLIRFEYGGTRRDIPPLVVIPAMEARQSEISLSSPLPPG